jgi:hypothetical protein
LKNRFFIYVGFLFFSEQFVISQENNVVINLLQYKVIENYVFIELSIVNHESYPIFVLKNYSLSKIETEEMNNKTNIFLKSSWIPKIIIEEGIESIPLGVFHMPNNQEIRSEQTISLSLLVEFPTNYQLTGNEKIQLFGIKYFDNRYFLSNNYKDNDLKKYFSEISKYIFSLDYITTSNSLLD